MACRQLHGGAHRLPELRAQVLWYTHAKSPHLMYSTAFFSRPTKTYPLPHKAFVSAVLTAWHAATLLISPHPSAPSSDFYSEAGLQLQVWVGPWFCSLWLPAVMLCWERCLGGWSLSPHWTGQQMPGAAHTAASPALVRDGLSPAGLSWNSLQDSPRRREGQPLIIPV